MHLCTLVFIYSYISLSIHIPLYHLCIISFMRFYHDLAIHILFIFLSCMLLLIHVFLSCSIYSFMYDNHIFISYTLIFISCHLLVTSYILLTYIFIYFIGLSYLMTYTYTFLYLYVFLVLYQTVLSPVGVWNKDSSFDTYRYFSYLYSFTYQIYIYCYFFVHIYILSYHVFQLTLTKRLVHLVQQFNFQTRCVHQMPLNRIWLYSRLNDLSIKSKNTYNGVLTKELCKLQAVKKINNLQHLQQQQQPLSFVIFGCTISSILYQSIYG